MAIEAAMALTNRLLAQAQALAAITAHMRAAAEGRSLDPDLQRAVERVVETLDARAAIDGLSESDRPGVTAFARSYLRQAMELAEEPFRASSWSQSDPTLLEAVDAMVTIRSGGSALEPGDAAALLSSVGFADVTVVSRTWEAPLRLVSGRRCSAADSAGARRSASAEA